MHINVQGEHEETRILTNTKYEHEEIRTLTYKDKYVVHEEIPILTYKENYEHVHTTRTGAASRHHGGTRLHDVTFSHLIDGIHGEAVGGSLPEVHDGVGGGASVNGADLLPVFAGHLSAHDHVLRDVPAVVAVRLVPVQCDAVSTDAPHSQHVGGGRRHCTDSKNQRQSQTPL